MFLVYLAPALLPVARMRHHTGLPGLLLQYQARLDTY